MEQPDGKQTNQNCSIISTITNQLKGSRELNSSMSSVKVTLTFCFPRNTSCLS